MYVFSENDNEHTSWCSINSSNVSNTIMVKDCFTYESKVANVDVSGQVMSSSARVFPHRPRSLRQRGNPTAKESMEDPQLVEAMLHEPLKLYLDDLQLVLLMGRTP